jgi:lysophospholipase L1-like esterase
MNKKPLFIAAAAALAIAGCKPHMDTPNASAGNLDFTRYVAVGNSLTAGYADGTLYRSGQENSYPSILARQFAMVGGGEFKQPLLNGESGYPGVKRVLGLSGDCLGVTSLGPVFFNGSRDTAGDAASIALQGPYNNLGVPGIRAIDYLLPGYPSLNPYSRRFFTYLTQSPLAEFNRITPTFFTAWIGNNDVLGYATSGGAGRSSGGSFLDQNSISSTTLFTAAVDSVLRRLTVTGAEGAVMNIPDVTAVPFFTTVPYNGLALTRQGQVDSLNAAYRPAGITFNLGQNAWIIQDTAVPVLRFRQIRAGELVLLSVPQDSLKCGGWGSRKPIPAQYILDAREITAVNAATTTFNGILQSAAARYKLAYVDMNTYLKTFSAGMTFDGVSFNTTFVRGGLFSLDGVHLTPRGYALAANEMIRTINAFYGSAVPGVDVNRYPGIAFPN